MNKLIRNSLSSIFVFILSACNLFGPQTTIIGNTPVVRLTVQTQNGSTTFSQAGQVIVYNYVVTNTGTSPLGGPVIILDGTKQVTCPAVNTVGNLDNYLDLNETITCTASYTITQADVTTGSVINVATATVGGVTSNQGGLTLTLGPAQPSGVLKLDKTASSQTYGQAGESITYMFNITNTGTTPLGPTQFTITDSKLGPPLNCGPADTTLAPNQSISCSAPYTITPADANLANITNSATASGGAQTSAPASVIIANLAAPATQIPPTTAPSSNLTPGSTIQHQVAVGEWLIQIVRCYGATYTDVRNANPQISDPDFILPAMIVTVPRIGSAGKIYGPPCISFYTAQGGDTWASIAQRYNADIAVLQKANPGGLAAGAVIKVPLNSAGSTISVGPTTAPPIVTTIPPTSTTVMRITISPGQTTAAQVGIINPNETIHYVINATQGQTLSIKLTAPANEVAIGVNGPTGLALKPLDASPIWTTTITTSGDYYIDLASLTGGSSKSYTLEISLTPSSAPVATATNTPTTPAP